MNDAQYFVRKPFYIFGHKVTDENMEKIAVWCGGKIDFAEPRGRKGATKFIKVDVINPVKEFHTRAYPGNWVLRMGEGFKVFTERALLEAFDKVDESVAKVESPATHRRQFGYGYAGANTQTEDLFSPPVGRDSERVLVGNSDRLEDDRPYG